MSDTPDTPDACNFCGADGFEIDELNPYKFSRYPTYELGFVCDYCLATYLSPWSPT